MTDGSFILTYVFLVSLAVKGENDKSHPGIYSFSPEGTLLRPFHISLARVRCMATLTFTRMGQGVLPGAKERKTRKSQRGVLTTHLFKASSVTEFLLKLLNSGQVLSIHSITWTSRLIKETSQVPQALPSTIVPATLQRHALCFSVSHIARSVPRHSNHFSFTSCVQHPAQCLLTRHSIQVCRAEQNRHDRTENKTFFSEETTVPE